MRVRTLAGEAKVAANEIFSGPAPWRRPAKLVVQKAGGRMAVGPARYEGLVGRAESLIGRGLVMDHDAVRERHRLRLGRASTRSSTCDRTLDLAAGSILHFLAQLGIETFDRAARRAAGLGGG